MIEHCTHYVNSAGQEVPITQAYINKLNETIEKFAHLTLRTLLIGYKKSGSVDDSPEEAFKNLTALALVGIKDPIR